MKHVTARILWQACHALTWLMALLVLVERLIPGSVLGYGPLFLGVPLLVVCIGFKPAPTRPSRWWSSLDLIIVALILAVRIFQQLFFQDSLSRLLAILATLLLVTFLGVCLSDDQSTQRN